MSYDEYYYERPAKPSPPAGWTTSRISDGIHHPVLDIDMAATLTSSRTPGHHHLVIDRAMTWGQYKRLLRALARAGIVEKAWVHASIRSGATYVEPVTR